MQAFEAMDHRVRAFLETLDAGGGKPMEELSPREARQVLTSLQATAEVQLPRRGRWNR